MRAPEADIQRGRPGHLRARGALLGALFGVAALLVMLALVNGARADDRLPAASVVVVVDNSLSTSDSDPQDLRWFGPRYLATQLAHGDELAVLRFGGSVSVDQPMVALTDDGRLDVLNRLQPYPREAYTDTVAALARAFTILETARAPDAGRAVVMLTDGEPYPRGIEDWSASQRAAYSDALHAQIQAFAERGWRVFAVSLRDAIQVDVLDEMAGTTGGVHLRAPEASDLPAAFARVISLLTPDTATASVAAAGCGSREIDVDRFAASLRLTVFREPRIPASLTDPTGQPVQARWVSALGDFLAYAVAQPQIGRWTFDGCTLALVIDRPVAVQLQLLRPAPGDVVTVGDPIDVALELAADVGTPEAPRREPIDEASVALKIASGATVTTVPLRFENGRFTGRIEPEAIPMAGPVDVTAEVTWPGRVVSPRTWSLIASPAAVRPARLTIEHPAEGSTVAVGEPVVVEASFMVEVDGPESPRWQPIENGDVTASLTDRAGETVSVQLVPTGEGYAASLPATVTRQPGTLTISVTATGKGVARQSVQRQIVVSAMPQPTLELEAPAPGSKPRPTLMLVAPVPGSSVDTSADLPIVVRLETDGSPVSGAQVVATLHAQDGRTVTRVLTKGAGAYAGVIAELGAALQGPVRIEVEATHPGGDAVRGVWSIIAVRPPEAQLLLRQPTAGSTVSADQGLTVAAELSVEGAPVGPVTVTARLASSGHAPVERRLTYRGGLYVAEFGPDDLEPGGELRLDLRAEGASGTFLVAPPPEPVLRLLQPPPGSTVPVGAPLRVRVAFSAGRRPVADATLVAKIAPVGAPPTAQQLTNSSSLYAADFDAALIAVPGDVQIEVTAERPGMAPVTARWHVVAHDEPETAAGWLVPLIATGVVVQVIVLGLVVASRFGRVRRP